MLFTNAAYRNACQVCYYWPNDWKFLLGELYGLYISAYISINLKISEIFLLATSLSRKNQTTWNVPVIYFKQFTLWKFHRWFFLTKGIYTGISINAAISKKKHDNLHKVPFSCHVIYWNGCSQLKAPKISFDLLFKSCH